jgi:hypothetical protein
MTRRKLPRTRFGVPLSPVLPVVEPLRCSLRQVADKANGQPHWICRYEHVEQRAVHIQVLIGPDNCARELVVWERLAPAEFREVCRKPAPRDDDVLVGELRELVSQYLS